MTPTKTAKYRKVVGSGATAYRYVQRDAAQRTTGGAPPDLMLALQQSLEAARNREGSPDPGGIDELLAWARDPDSIDWSHLERIDQEGWRLDK